MRHLAAAWCPHLPSPRWGCWLPHSTLPPPFSFVCELLMPPALPCLAAAVTADEGGRHCLQQPNLCPQKAACAGPTGLGGHMPGPWSQGWWTVPPFPSLPWEPAWVAHWERVPLAVAPEPGVAIGGLHRAGLVRAAGHWRPHKGIVCRGKRGFCLLLETGQREEQFPPFITNSPI